MKKLMFSLIVSAGLLVGCGSSSDVVWVETTVPAGGSLWGVISEETEGGDIRNLVFLYEQKHGSVEVRANQVVEIPVVK